MARGWEGNGQWGNWEGIVHSEAKCNNGMTARKRDTAE